MKCIVTGATGFIGSYLCQYLYRKGHIVIPLSRAIPQAWISQFGPVESIACDILSPALAELRVSADVVIHLASSNDIISRDTRSGVELSVLGTKNVLDFAVNNQIGKFVFFSTFQVYGSEVEGMIDEAAPLRPENDYALNHIFAEQYVEMYARKGKISAAIVRPTNVYGRMASTTVDRWTLVPACFCKEAYFNQTITLLSSGKQMRNFISLENVARAAECLLNGFPARLDVINFGSAINVSVIDAAKMVRSVYNRLYSKEVEIIVQSALPKQSNAFSVSMKKLNSYGFMPDEHSTLETEINEVFKYLERCTDIRGN